MAEAKIVIFKTEYEGIKSSLWRESVLRFMENSPNIEDAIKSADEIVDAFVERYPLESLQNA